MCTKSSARFLFLISMVCLFIFSHCSKSITGAEKAANLSTSVATKQTTLSCECPFSCDDTACIAYGTYCGYIVDYHSVPVTHTDGPDSVPLAGLMSTMFDSLKVDFAMLSSVAGLDSTFTSNDIDFDNLSKVYDANKPGAGIVAPFKSNSNSNTDNYAFTVFTSNGHCYGSPTLVKTSASSIVYFDLLDGTVNQVNNYTSLTNTIFSTMTLPYVTDSAIFGSNRTIIPWEPYAFNSAGPYLSFKPYSTGCGQAVADCIADAYSHHGWVSVWATIQTAFIPSTATALASACVAKNCLIAAHPGLYKCVN